MASHPKNPCAEQTGAPDSTAEALVRSDQSATGMWRPFQSMAGEAEEILALAERSAGIGVWDVDLATDMARGTAQFFRIMGLEPTDELVPMARIRALRHPEDRQRVVDGFRRALEGGVDIYEIEYRILRPDGEVRWIFGRGRAVRDAEGRPIRYSGVDMDVTARKQAEAERARLAAIVEASGDAIYSWALDGAILSWNPEAERLLGYTAQEALGRQIWMLIPPEHQSAANRIVQRVAAGESLLQVETERLRKDGRRVAVALTVSPIRDAAGKVVAAATIARDVTARKQAEERQKLLVAELDHRVKNALATVQSIAVRTLGQGAASQSLVGRIAALAKAHTALSQTAWRGVELHALLEDVLAAHQPGSDRLSLAGPPTLLEAKPAQALALAANELGTNAAKYGALSTPRGRVEIRWQLASGAEPRLLFTWKELDGPRTVEPKRRGFGTELIERSLAYELGAEVEIRFEADGLFCRIDAPIGLRPPSSAGEPPPADVDANQPHSSGELSGRRVLVAEDAHLIAADVAEALRKEGALVVGPAPSLGRAIELSTCEAVDAAVLDINLDGEMIFPLAESLIARAVPFVLLTGYERGGVLPESLRSIPLVNKPARAETVVAALKQVCARSNSGDLRP